jgi:ABC-type Zn2+ transport system substrate-binding protein/surface adhesin
MRKYAIVIRKFQRRLNIAISDFLDIRVYGFEEDFENKEEDDDSKLSVYDPWSHRVEDAKEDEDQDEDEDKYNDSHYRNLYGR